MSFWSYLADRAVPLLVRAVALAFAALVMSVSGVEGAVVAFVCGVLVLAAFVALVLDWLHRRGFYQQISDALDSLDETYLATELVERPHFLEGELFFDALDRESKAMRDRLAAARHRQREYREYVETWVHEIKTPIAAAHLVAHNNPSPEVDAMDAEVGEIEGYVERRDRGLRRAGALLLSRNVARPRLPDQGGLPLRGGARRPAPQGPHAHRGARDARARGP